LKQLKVNQNPVLSLFHPFHQKVVIILDQTGTNTIYCLVYLFAWVLRHTVTVFVIWRRSSASSGGRPQVPFRALYQAQMVTRVEPPTLRKLAGYLPHLLHRENRNAIACRSLLVSK
jgi:hypothetical protein